MIKQELKDLPVTGVYKAKEIKREIIEFYSKNLERLEAVPEEQFLKHSFVTEALKKSELREKQSYKKRLLKITKGLQRHLYAPELNEIKTVKGNFYKTPQKTELEKAIDYLIMNSSVTKIKQIVLKG